MRREETPRGLRLRCELRPSGEREVEAVCLDVGVSAWGPTAEAAQGALAERLRAFLEASWDEDAPRAPRPAPRWERLLWHAHRFGLGRATAYVEALTPAEVEALEDRVDRRAAEDAEKEAGRSIPWSEAKADLGL